MANLKDLATISQQLNEKSNQANQFLHDFEAKLNDMKLGVEVWLEDDPLSEAHSTFIDEKLDEEIQRKTETVLGYGKHGEKFLLLVKWVESESSGSNPWRKISDRERKPLLQAPREIRIKAMEKVEALIEEMQNEGMRLLDSIEKGEQAVKNL